MDNAVQNLLKLVVVESSTVDLALYLMYHKYLAFRCDMRANLPPYN